MTFRGSAVVAALASAVLFVLYGLLLGRLPDLQPPYPGANPAFVDGLRVLFVVVGVLLAVLYAWRYISVARAATAGMLEVRHCRQLRKARRSAIWAVLVLVLVCAAVSWRLPEAVPLAVICLVVAPLWVWAATATIRAERAQPDIPRRVTGARS